MHIEVMIAPYEYTPGKYVAYREMCVYDGRAFMRYAAGVLMGNTYHNPGFKFSVILN